MAYREWPLTDGRKGRFRECSWMESGYCFKKKANTFKLDSLSSRTRVSMGVAFFVENAEVFMRIRIKPNNKNFVKCK